MFDWRSKCIRVYECLIGIRSVSVYQSVSECIRVYQSVSECMSV